MAFCGADFTDEKKTDEVLDDDSLDNVRAFSTKKRQMGALSQEGLLTQNNDGKEVDRRIKIIYRDAKFSLHRYSVLSQLTARLRNGNKVVGSCTLVGKAKTGFREYLTCAHNLVGLSGLTNKFVPWKMVNSYNGRQGEGIWISRSQVDSKDVRVHPKYDGTPECGFDIAVLQETKLVSQKFGVNNYWKSPLKVDLAYSGVNPKEIKNGMSVELAGYPGEKKGWPYAHTGVIKSVTKTALGGWIVWYDADSTPGNSGSCLMISDKKLIKSFGFKSDIKKVVVGVHTGHDDVEGLNFGTLITSTIMSWIRENATCGVYNQN